MQLRYQPTKKDIVSGVFANYRRHRILWLIVRAALICGIAAFLLRVFLPNFYPGLTANGLPVALFAALYLWILPRIGAYLLYSKAPWMKGEWTLTVNHEGLHWRWGAGVSDLEWENFAQWYESPNEFLLFLSRGAFYIVPKRVFSNQELSELRDLFSQKIAAG